MCRNTALFALQRRLGDFGEMARIRVGGRRGLAIDEDRALIGVTVEAVSLTALKDGTELLCGVQRLTLLLIGGCALHRDKDTSGCDERQTKLEQHAKSRDCAGGDCAERIAEKTV